MTKFVFFIITLFYSSSVVGQCFINGMGSLGQLYKTTGNAQLDHKFNFTKGELERLFGLRSVDLYIYQDGASPNAFATHCQKAYCDGMVAFGYNMLVSRLWEMNKGEYAVAGIMAHEFAHVLQLKKGCTLRGKHRELHADFLAGYYFGKNTGLGAGLRNFANDLFSLGDYAFWSEQHHGTPEERVNAMLAGYNKRFVSSYSAYQEGIRYLSTRESEEEEEEAESTGEVNKACYDRCIKMATQRCIRVCINDYGIDRRECLVICQPDYQTRDGRTNEEIWQDECEGKCD